TADGLNRYDGYNVKSYRQRFNDTTSIANNFINTIFHDHRNGFWIGTDDGLSFYSIRTDKFKNFLKGKGYRVVDGALINDFAIAMIISNNGIYELYEFDVTRDKLTKIECEISGYEVKIKKDYMNRIWVVTQESIIKLNWDTGLSVSYIFRLPDNLPIKDFDVCLDDKLYVASHNEIFIYDMNFGLQRKVDIPYHNSGIRCIKTDNNFNLWISSVNSDGILLYNYYENNFNIFNDENLDGSIIINNIRVIFQDAGSVLWFGSDGGGILVHNLAKQKFKTLKYNPKDFNSLSIDFPKGMTFDRKGNLWISTVLGGLNKYNINSNKWEHYSSEQNNQRHVSSNTGLAVFTDSKGTVWYGSNKQIDTLNVNSKQFRKFATIPNVQCFFEDKKGRLWIGNSEDLFLYNSSDNSITRIGDLIADKSRWQQKYVYSICESNEGIIWFGTNDGLYSFNQSDAELKHYKYDDKDASSLSNNYVLTLLNDSRGNLWAGTRYGLNFYQKETDDFFRLTSAEGLSNSFIYGIVEDLNSEYWISTNRGLSKMIFKNTVHYSFRNFTKTDGLQSNEFNTNSYCKSEDNYLFFGGVGGINYFHPDSLGENKNLPNVVITKILMFDSDFNTAVNPTVLDELKLPYHKNTLSFEFTGLDFAAPQLNRYAFYLEGLDTGWVYSGNTRFARYPNLKPGTYKFRVKSSNNDGIWNETGRTLIIEINPPIWLTLEFKIFSILLLGSSLVIAYKTRVRSINNRNRELTEIVNNRTEELKRKNNMLIKHAVEITKINQSLERRVAERTFELQQANDKLLNILDDITESKSDSLKAIIKAQEDERSRFAKDLHDGAGQYLSFLKFNLNNIMAKLDDDNIKDNLKEQIKLIDNIVKELRQFAYSLMPPVLERIGLTAAIEELIEIFKSQTNIKYDFYIQEKKKQFPKYVKIHIYRVVQEVLNNAVKHSNCSKISFQMLSYPKNLLIIIEDNGRGFNPATSKSGMGLKNLQSRITLINGKIDIDSQTNHGTTITIEVPF
ncbi:MAG: two-component regulator propeller domain-containing protein, partial [Candidatus Kapaibacterium sp.]